MAVMYSKLGGCLGVTTKMGPLARTDLWAGVKGLLERLMTHLRLGSSLEEPWGATRGSGWGVFLGDGAVLLGRLGGPVPGGMPVALPDWPSRIVRLTCLGITASFARRKESSSLGGIATFPGRKDSSCLGITASLTGRKESSGLGGIATFWGKVSSCWESIASFPSRKESSCLGETASIRGKVSSCLGETASFWGKVSVVRRELLPSPGGRWAMAGGRLWLAPAWPLVWSVLLLAYLIVWETKLLDQIVAIALVIFPCFLLIRLLNLFSCLCLTLVNLISLTLSMKPWHSLSFSAEIIKANWLRGTI